MGAGASMDAGVPGAEGLTVAVYNYLNGNDGNAARLFAYVHAKLVAKHARKGGSPFQTLGIEEVYDSLKKLVHKSEDPLSEFVTAWDSTFLPSSFDRSRFEDVLDRSFSALRIGMGDATSGASRELANTIDRGFKGA